LLSSKRGCLFKKGLFKSLNAQTSMEFVFMMAIALMLLIPATIVFNKYANDSQQALINTQIHKVGSELIHLSEKMHASGVAWETIEITLPGAVNSLKVYNGTVSELVISYEVDRTSDSVFFTNVRLYNQTGIDCTDGCVVNIHPGSTEIRIESYRTGEVILNSRG